MREHGTESKYKGGCHCEACMQAHRDYNRLRYGIRKGRPKPVMVERPTYVDRLLELAFAGGNRATQA